MKTKISKIICLLFVLTSSCKLNPRATLLADSANMSGGTTATCSASTTDYTAVGAGTILDPWQICTAAQLVSISQNTSAWGDHFILVDDIDLADYYTNGGTDFSIGLYGATCFDGIFNGAGHSISDFHYVDAGKDGVGLFSCVDPGAEIKNLNMIDATVEGNLGVGIVAGVINNIDVFEKITTSGTVTGHDSGVGGVAGFIVTIGVNDINHLSSSANIIADANYAGGLFGYIGGGSAVRQSFTTGNISGGGVSIGGLIGQSALTSGVHDCYTTGNVTTTGDTAGGVIGISSKGGIYRSYASGQVSSLRLVGGINGYMSGTTTDINDSFFVGVKVEASNMMLDFFAGLFAGRWDSGTFSNNYALAASACIPSNGQSCNAHGVGATHAAMADFYLSTNPPLDQWNFTTIWLEHAGSLPTLRGF